MFSCSIPLLPQINVFGVVQKGDEFLGCKYASTRVFVRERRDFSGTFRFCFATLARKKTLGYCEQHGVFIVARS